MIMDIENINISNSEVTTKKTRNKPSKYTEEEKKERHKAALKRYFDKQEVKEKHKEYYKNKYENMTEEEKKSYINNSVNNCMIKYNNMTEEQKKEYLIKCRPYKRKYCLKMKEQNLNNYVVCV